MRMTLLKMVQMILSAMDSDEINSINDTAESVQVVDQIESCYNDIISTIEFPEHWTLFELDPSLDVERPTVMYIPDDIAQFEWIQYDYNPLAVPNPAEGDHRQLRYVWPMSRENFFNRMNALGSVDRPDQRVTQFDLMVGSERFDVRVWNNKEPSYYTCIDNRTLLFDSFDNTRANTLVSDRTMAYGQKIPVFLRQDSFVPNLEPRQFTLLYNEAKAQCFSDLKQVTNGRAEQKARRGWVHSQRKKATNPAAPIKDSYTNNYGRGGRKYAGPRTTSGIGKW